MASKSCLVDGINPFATRKPSVPSRALAASPTFALGYLIRKARHYFTQGASVTLTRAITSVNNGRFS